jgi:hypothetical protein
MMASSRDEGCCCVMSVRNGSPRPVMKSWICWASVRDVSWQERAMKHLLNSSTVLVRRSMASSPIGLSVREGGKPGVHQLHELRPCRATVVEFHAMEPQECHTFVLWCLTNEEIALALIEPRERITSAVIL